MNYAYPRRFAMQFLFLLNEISFKRLLKFRANVWYKNHQTNSFIEQFFIKCYDDKELLYMHFHDSLPDEGCTKKCPKWNEVMAAGQSS